MTNTWFTADLHLSHRKVTELRGFTDPEEHDSVVLSGIADTVSPGDTVWVLGDLSSGGSAAQRNALASLDALAWSLRLELHLVAGNHDGVHPMHRKALSWDHRYRRVFASVQPFARRRLNGHNVWLSHFPWNQGGDHTPEDRYPTVRLNDDGCSWLMHGHTHSPAPIDRDRRMLHVGVDAWNLTPVPIETVRQLITKETE